MSGVAGRLSVPAFLFSLHYCRIALLHHCSVFPKVETHSQPRTSVDPNSTPPKFPRSYLFFPLRGGSVVDGERPFLRF